MREDKILENGKIEGWKTRNMTKRKNGKKQKDWKKDKKECIRMQRGRKMRRK